MLQTLLNKTKIQNVLGAVKGLICWVKSKVKGACPKAEVAAPTTPAPKRGRKKNG